VFERAVLQLSVFQAEKVANSVDYEKEIIRGNVNNYEKEINKACL
jgi:hypothetical protein